MPSLSNYVCVKCSKEMRGKKSGVYVEEHAKGNGPYKIWQADLLYCPYCGIEIIAGFGRNPVAEHFEEKYPLWKERVTHHVYEPTDEDWEKISKQEISSGVKKEIENL